MHFEIVRLGDRPELKEQAAQWFHKRGGIPYMESMGDCLKTIEAVPQWYVAMEE